MNQLENFRKQKDDFYKNDDQSPFTPEQQKTFKGLVYFPEDASLRFEAIVDEFEKKDQISMPTSTGSVQKYVRFGKIKFTVDGQPSELTIYTSGHEYFLPFADSLAGKETYGAGRYMEPKPIEHNKVLVDFNYAYNPYCAYNDNWSCPITPAENRLKVPIRAGEKIYENH